MLAGPVLNSEEAAKYLGLTGGGQAMRAMKWRGEGPRAYRVGRRLVYLPADLDAWLAEHAEVAA